MKCSQRLGLQPKGTIERALGCCRVVQNLLHTAKPHRKDHGVSRLNDESCRKGGDAILVIVCGLGNVKHRHCANTFQRVHIEFESEIPERFRMTTQFSRRKLREANSFLNSLLLSGWGTICVRIVPFHHLGRQDQARVADQRKYLASFFDLTIGAAASARKTVTKKRSPKPDSIWPRSLDALLAALSAFVVCCPTFAFMGQYCNDIPHSQS